MTIDEKIQDFKIMAKNARKDNDNCKYKSQYGCKGYADYYSKPCIECAEECEQLASWLEELSRRRVEELFRKTNEKSIRDKAIDDFVNACKDDILCQTFGLRQCDIEKIAERLKESDISAKQFEG